MGSRKLGEAVEVAAFSCKAPQARQSQEQKKQALSGYGDELKRIGMGHLGGSVEV